MNKNIISIDLGPTIRALQAAEDLATAGAKANIPLVPVCFHEQDGRNRYWSRQFGEAARRVGEKPVNLPIGSFILAREDGAWNIGILAAFADQPATGFKVIWLPMVDVKLTEVKATDPDAGNLNVIRFVDISTPHQSYRYDAAHVAWPGDVVHVFHLLHFFAPSRFELEA
jgi:hypothetical protein